MKVYVNKDYVRRVLLQVVRCCNKLFGYLKLETQVYFAIDASNTILGLL